MISREDLEQAIIECRAERNPDASTCRKLAAYYTIKDHLFPDVTEVGYSYSAEPPVVKSIETTVPDFSDSEFGQAVAGRKSSEIWPIVDELMSVLEATNPRLYAGVMRKIDD